MLKILCWLFPMLVSEEPKVAPVLARQNHVSLSMYTRRISGLHGGS